MTESPCAPYRSILVNIGEANEREQFVIIISGFAGGAILIPRRSCFTRSYFSAEMKSAAFEVRDRERRENERWGLRYRTLKISRLNPLRWLLKYEELKWEMGVQKKPQKDCWDASEQKGEIETLALSNHCGTVGNALEVSLVYLRQGWLHQKETTDDGCYE